MFSASPRLSGQAATAASRTSWQGSLVERALRALAEDYRRPTGPIVVAMVLAVTAALSATTSRPALTPAAAMLLALLATVPIAVIRRFPAAVIGIVLGASAIFLLAGRLAWPPPAVVGWLIAVAACPVMLSRKAAIRTFVLTEVVVLLAAVPAMPSATPWDATFAEALAVIAAWGAGEMLRSRRQSALDQAAAAQQLRYLSERDVLARGRASIARELHDVVAHHVSMIAVRASGFLLKDATPEEILSAVRIVGGGEALLAPVVTSRLIAEFAARARLMPPPKMSSLTPREREVLLLVAAGLANGEIARRLCLADQTVKSHVSSVLFKLGLRDRVQAVILAYESGLVVPGAGNG